MTMPTTSRGQARPPQWAVELLVGYLEAGCDGFVVNRCDGFVVNRDHGRPGLEERVLEFEELVAAPLRQPWTRSHWLSAFLADRRRVSASLLPAGALDEPRASWRRLPAHQDDPSFSAGCASRSI
jgi:hypothetical protein